MNSKAHIGLLTVVLSVVFVLLTTFVSAAQTMVILNGIFIGVFFSISTIYFPLLKQVFKGNGLDRSYQLVGAICLLWFSVFLNRVYWVVWKYYNSPIEWRNNMVQQLIAYLAVIAGCLFVTAPGYPAEGSDEKSIFGGTNRRLLIVSAIIGATVVYAISFKVDLF